MSTGCIEWQGNRDMKNYGRYSQKQAHRWVWEKANGAIPPGLFILHKCDNPPCVNLDHLYMGTKKDNARDMFDRKRVRRDGAWNPRSKLNVTQVFAIRDLLKSGLSSVPNLAKEFGVSTSCIRFIKQGRSWANV